MNKIIVLLCSVCLGMLFVTTVAFTEEYGDKEFTTGIPVVDYLLPFPYLKDKVKVYAAVDLQQGYDNNVNLNSKREEDGYSQFFSFVEIALEENEETSLTAGFDVFNITYYKYNKNNILSVMPYIKGSWKIHPEYVIKGSVSLDHFNHPNLKENTYTGIVSEVSLRNIIIEDIYQELGYVNIARWYPHRKTYIPSGQQGGEDRMDTRNIIKYTVGSFVFGRTLLKMAHEFYINDSNDGFQEYYDYGVYKFKPSATFFFTEDLYLNSSFTYKFRDYKDRRSTENIQSVIHENTTVYNTSLYYDITDNLTFGVTYSYRENYPSDPFYKYSGSLISSGLHLIF